MSRKYVALMIFSLGFALFMVANIPDTTPTPDVTTYSSAAWDHATPLPVRTMPVNPDTVPDAAPTDDSDSVKPVKSGDDNGDGRIDEDESGWDCRTMGNGECGPGATLTAEDGSQVPVSFYDD